MNTPKLPVHVVLTLANALEMQKGYSNTRAPHYTVGRQALFGYIDRKGLLIPGELGMLGDRGCLILDKVEQWPRSILLRIGETLRRGSMRWPIVGHSSQKPGHTMCIEMRIRAPHVIIVMGQSAPGDVEIARNILYGIDPR